MRPLEAVARWPAEQGAAGVAVRETTAGRPSVTLAGRVGDVDRVRPWASMTKLCTAMAILVAVEERTLALDDPAGPPGATVAHLLAHASGLGPGGERLAAPGSRRIYSSAGFDLLGDLLAARAAMPFEQYLTEAVLRPAGLRTASLAPGASAATGLAGSLGDLLALAGELLTPRLIAPGTLAAATAIAFPELAGVLPGFGQQDPCDWGLGFELKDHKDPHWTGQRNSPQTFGHFGQSGGFLWVDPLRAVACTVITATPFGPWAASAWPELSDAVLEELYGAAD